MTTRYQCLATGLALGLMPVRGENFYKRRGYPAGGSLRLLEPAVV